MERVLEQNRQLGQSNTKEIVCLLKEQINSLNNDMFRKYKIRQSIDILEKSYELFGGCMAVAFSGGKDSLVALYLSLQINPDIYVIYNNTTLEFPETLLYVKQLTDKWSLNLKMTSPKIRFFDTVKEKGWANHQDRWCCRPCKDEPAFDFLTERRIRAEVTGTTRTESIYRRSLSPIKIPKKPPYLIRVNPIYDWNEWEVWDYIRENNLPYNPLYDMGSRRIGCWCCPLNGPSHYKRLRKTHPKLFDFLEKFEPKHPYFANIK